MATMLNILLATLWGVSIAGITWCCLQAARSITFVTLADGQKAERRLPIIMRLLLPLTPNLTLWLTSPRLNREKKRIDRKLIAAGFEEVMTSSDFLALRILVPLVMAPVLMALLWTIVPGIHGKIGVFLTNKLWLLHITVILLAILYPASWLQKELVNRHKNIERSLPFILDLLTLSVEAGMDFMSGLQRIVDKRRLDPLCEELIRVLREIQLGKTRRQAIQNMAIRIAHPDVISVTNALVQADEMGASIGKTLRIQADQMRMKRFQRAEKMAYEAPVKMLFPLIAFIFPAVFLVLLGPVFYQMTQRLY
ncbi:MAG: type II secretion system F family protein [bacterium]